MKKVFSILFLILVYSFGNIRIADASGNFAVSSDIIYTFAENGTMHVSFNNTLTNTNSRYYATSYNIDTGFDDITNITASDPEGSMQPDIIKTKSGIRIKLVFNKRSVGIGKSFTFHLSFDTTHVASKEKNIWEINIPGIVNADAFDDFTIHVNTPDFLGKPSYIKPPIASTKTNGFLTFTKSQLQKSGISLAFGNTQTYAFTLSYHLKNPNLFSAPAEIALPSTTNYQDVSIKSISPKPTNVIIDSDGNWLAQYHLAASEQKDITVQGAVKVALTPKKQPLTKEQMQEYIKQTIYWESENTTIRKTAQNLKTPQAIYNYVVKTLTYDYSRITSDKPRVGALQAFTNPSSAVCLEFTDLFIALSRAAGIPAREVDGFAYAQNQKQYPVSLVKDVLHAWPEYYDFSKQTWIMVDPTWGNTTGGTDYFHMLDFDHVTFVIKGKSSTYPLPAGLYKVSAKENTKDITIRFTDSYSYSPSKLFLSVDSALSFIAGLPIADTLNIKNDGSNLVSQASLLVSAESLTPRRQQVIIPDIPPYGSVSFPVYLDASFFLTNKNETITIRTTNNTLQQSVSISPFYTKRGIVGGVILGIFTIIILIITTKTRRLSFFR